MLASFWSELKRRHAMRVAGVYTASSWGLFQIARTIIETLKLPAWTSPLVLTILALGLPVALVVAWIGARRPAQAAGGTPEPESAEGEPTSEATPRLSPLDVAMLSGLALMLAISIAQFGGLMGGAGGFGPGASARSVAVLPFVTFRAGGDTEYFADGLTEEIINSLAQAPELKVTGRTSSFYFKDKNQDLREIGAKLGVAHVLEGSVRREADRLRVTAQLVSVKDGFHLWSDTYDRRFNDAFEIQTEIGHSVADALKAKLRAGGAAATGRNPSAYALQLDARGRLRRQGQQDLQIARSDFERLARLEPNNASAHAGYAQATITLAQNFLSTDFAQAQGLSQSAADTAVRIAPTSSEAWLARAVVNRVLSIRNGSGEYERAFDQSIRRAVELDPRNPDALRLLAVRLSDIGQATEAVATARKAVELDPLNRQTLLMLGQAEMRVGDLAAAEARFRTICDLYPDFDEGKYRLGMMLVEAGRLDQAEPWLAAASASGQNPTPAFSAAWVYMNLGLPEDAHRASTSITASPGRELGYAGDLGLRGDFAGLLRYGQDMRARSSDPFWPVVVLQAAAMVGRYDDALKALRDARPDLLAPNPPVATTDLGLPILAAEVLEKTGNAGQATQLREAVLAATASKPGQRTPNDQRIARAEAFAGQGRRDEAVAELRAAADAGWRAPFLFEESVWIEDAPAFRTLRDDPRFKGLMARVRSDLAAQRAAVLARRRAAPALPTAATGLHKQST